MVEMDETRLLQVLRQTVRDIALAGYGRLGADDISTKSSPQDLVTKMDLAVEAALIERLPDVLPGAAIVGEEGVAADPALLDQVGEAELSVILDPIDGTWNYAHEVPLWGAILAVCRFGVPIFGAIYDPMSDHILYAGDGGLQAWRGGEPTASPGFGPKRATGFVPLQLFPEPRRLAVAEAAARTGLVSSYRCSAHEYRSVALGLAAWQITGPRPMPWDHAAGAHLVRAAGGVARMLDGSDYTAGKTREPMLAARDQATWDRIAAALGPALQ